MGTKVRGDGKVTIEKRRSNCALEIGQVWRLPPDNGEEELSNGIPPGRKRSFVCAIVVSQRTLGKDAVP